MRDNHCLSARGKRKFLALPAKKFQGRAATAWRKDHRVKERRVKKKRKTDGKRMERTGMWHSSRDVQTSGKCTQLQIASIQNSKEFAQERWEIKSASKQNSALHDHWVLSVIACFLAQHAEVDVCCSDLTCSLGDRLLRVISACNEVCLSILQASDSLTEWMIWKAIEKCYCQAGCEQAALGAGDSWLRTQHQLFGRQAAARRTPRSERSRAPGTGSSSLLAVMWTANSSVGLHYS